MRFVHALRTLISNPRVRIFTILGAAFTAVGILTEGFQYWTWLSANWSWVLGWVRSPYFYWGVTIFGLALLATGVRNVAVAELAATQQSDARAEELLVRETAILKQTLELPLMMMKAAFHANELAILNGAIDNFSRQFDHYKKEAAMWLATDAYFSWEPSMQPPDPETVFREDFWPFLIVANPAFLGDWQKASITPVYSEGPTHPIVRQDKFYSSEKNEDLKIAIKLNIQRAEKRIEQLKSLLSNEQFNLSLNQKEINRRTSQH